MATKNAINSNIPIEITKGGIGASSLTDHGVLVGSGTGAITPLSVGATGTLLVGVTAGDPIFSNSATGDFTFTSSTANQTRLLTVINDDNTGAASSAARIDITVGGANVGDPQISYIVTGQQTYSVGIDNNDSDKYKIAASTTLGSSDILVSTAAGEVTMPLQPAFLASLSTTQNNVTGAATFYSYVANTEIFDQNSDYNNSTGVFTAPVTGRYLLTNRIYLSGAVAAFSIQAFITTSNREYFNGYARSSSSADIYTECTIFADMDAGDTAIPKARVIGEASDVCDLNGVSGAETRTAFGGYLAV